GGADRLAIQQHGGGTARTVGGDGLGTGELELVAEHFQQRHSRLDLDLMVFAVDVQFEARGAGPDQLRPLLLPASNRGSNGEGGGRSRRTGAFEELAAVNAGAPSALIVILHAKGPSLCQTIGVEQWRPPGKE